jgi:fatty acid amide hydrolase 2
VFQEKLGDNGVLLYPSHPFPAVYHYSSFLRPYNFGYWAVFNVLNLPVTQVPMGLNKDGLPLGIQVHIIIVQSK